MSYTIEEIVDGLEMIQSICKNNNNCVECPFFYNRRDDCMFINSDEECPSDWKINSKSNWRAFD